MKMNDKEDYLESVKFKELIEEYLLNKGYSRDMRYYEFEFDYLFSILDSSQVVLNMISYYTTLDFKGKIVLEAGCGAGGISIIATEKGAKVTGVDLDIGKLKIANFLANSKKFDIDFVCKDLKNNGCKNNYFDIIININVLEHTEPLSLLLNLYGYLKPNGKMILKTPNKLFPFETHIKTFFIHFLPVKFVDYYLKKRYSEFFLDYPSFSDIHLLSLFKLKKLLNKLPKGCKYDIFPVFYPFFPKIKGNQEGNLNFLKYFSVLKNSKILNKIFTNKKINLFAQSWIIIIEKGDFK